MAIVDGWRQRERETERECAYGGRDMLLVKAVNVVKILNCIIMQGKNCIMLKNIYIDSAGNYKWKESRSLPQ